MPKTPVLFHISWLDSVAARWHTDCLRRRESSSFLGAAVTVPAKWIAVPATTRLRKWIVYTFRWWRRRRDNSKIQIENLQELLGKRVTELWTIEVCAKRTDTVLAAAVLKKRKRVLVEEDDDHPLSNIIVRKEWGYRHKQEPSRYYSPQISG